jgi:hypothetical protein
MTAAQGRCAGCLLTGDLRKVVQHFRDCVPWAELYRQGKDPLEPAQEYARWVDTERRADHLADLKTRVADTVARRDASAAQYQKRDILED